MEYTGKQYASKGVAGTALGLGIAGTALGLGVAGNNGCGNSGLFGGLFGGNDNGHCYVNEKELNLSTALAIAQSEAKLLETSKNDQIALFAELRTTDAKIADGLIQTGNALGVLNAEVSCLKESVSRNREESFRNLNEAKGYTDTRVTSEAQLRKCEDEKIITYTNGQLATKVTEVQNKIDASQVCGGTPFATPFGATSPCGY
ncbi:MAG: hypothetical protein R3Y60_01945 [bacterium]